MKLDINITESESLEMRELFLSLLKTNYITDRQRNTLELIISEIDKQY